MNHQFIVASVQLNSQDVPDDNLVIIERAIASASQQNAKLIVLPENACLMGNQHELAKHFDEICHHYQQLASKYSVHILAGTLPCTTRPDGNHTTHDKLRQVSLLFDDRGTQIARYDKIHLFCATVADGVGSYDEGRTFEAGDKLMVACCQIGGVAVNIGLMVCFDVRFALMAHRLRQLGADIISVPSAFTHTTGQAHWQTLLQARALDSQCMMVGAAQGGIHQFTHKKRSHTRQTWGHAMIVDANGQVVASTEQTDAGQMGFRIVYATFDKNKQQQIRQNMPLFACHQSNAIYQFT